MIIYPVRAFLTHVWFFLASTLVLPILLIRPRHRDNVVIYSRFVMPFCLWLCGIRVEVRGQANFDAAKPCVIVANHQSILDLFIHGSMIPAATATVGKKSITWIPIFGWVYA